MNLPLTVDLNTRSRFHSDFYLVSVDFFPRKFMPLKAKQFLRRSHSVVFF